MLDAALMSMSALVVGTLVSGESPQALGNAHPDYAGYATYTTRDDMLMVGAFTNEQMGALMRVLGDDERASAIESMPRSDIGTRRAADSVFLRSVFAQNSAHHWERVLNDAGVPAARVRRLDETLAEGQLATRAVLQSYPGNEADALPDALPTAAFTFEHGGPSIRSGPPTIGQHTEEILDELGYDAAVRRRLEKQGIVAT
jgi:crotonobetainyl-CoA:carnitine CoA-transferase CaiB-like acyl-CoA transferase